jgi:hypothetical protein
MDVIHLSKFIHINETIRRVVNKKKWQGTQITFCKIVAVPKLTQSFVAWTFTEKQWQKLNTEEMKFLRMWQDTY